MYRILLIFILFIANSAFAETTAPDQLVKQEISELMQRYQIPGVTVQMYVAGKPYEYYFGYANANKKTPVNKNTIFELGSVSKLMTSLLLAQQVDFARMQLNTYVTQYLPQAGSAYGDITLLDLATHTAGLPFDLPNNVKTEETLNQFLQQKTTLHIAQQKWRYSNVGIGILGYALQTQTHQSLDQLYRRRILVPLNMQQIGTTLPAKLKAFYAQGYDTSGQAVPPYTGGLLSAAAGVKASGLDMQHFLSAAIGLPGTPPRIFYPMRMTQTAYIKLPNRMQGLGWEINPINNATIYSLLNSISESGQTVRVTEVFERPIFDSKALYDKTGMTKGFRAYIAVLPDKKSGIVIMTNRNVPNSAIVATARALLFKTSGLVS